MFGETHRSLSGICFKNLISNRCSDSFENIDSFIDKILISQHLENFFYSDSLQRSRVLILLNEIYSNRHEG